MQTHTRLSSLACLFTSALMSLALAEEIPLRLPHPDGKPGDAAKPVKVYILAGQSNMVGMGDISGARPPYPSIFRSADPAILPGAMPIGGAGLGTHGIYSAAEGGAAGAMAAIYAGVYDANADYTKQTAVKTAPVALGTLPEKLPSVDGPHTVVVSAFIDVPATGTYTVHAGFEGSANNITTVNGNEVYRKVPGAAPVITRIPLEAGKRHPVRITYLQGGSAAFWLEQVDIQGKGDLKYLTQQEGKYAYLVDGEGKWTARNDVTYTDPRLFPTRPSSPLSATSNNGGSIGPELGFGSVMGHFHDEQVLLIKTAMGNRSLNWDFRPPSSGKTDRPGAETWEGLEYRLMVEGVRKTLGELEKVVPGYKGQGYEIAGFGWFQGHKDSGAPKEEYEKHLVNLINDVRKEFNAPKMPAVVATVGFHGYRIVEGPWQGIWEAQMAVGDPKQHPEFAGTVAAVDTRDFWREIEESPRSQDYHYNRNPETYLLIGEAMGRAMVRLHGGAAALIPKTDREARTAARVAEIAAKPAPTPEQKAASAATIRPMILDGALQAFVSDPRNAPALLAALKGERPAKPAPSLLDTLDAAADYYRAAGITDYDWVPFGGEIKDSVWQYHGFDLPAAQPDPKSKHIPVAPVAWPTGMENWFATDFDAGKAGWKTGAAPFGVAKDPNVYPEWYGASRRGPAKTIIENDVVILRQTFALPALKNGHRYRIRVNGSVHANHGEGYTLYLNGKLLAESKAGVTAWRKEGWKPRGSHIWTDVREEFSSGRVTLAVCTFPMNNRAPDSFIPSGQPLSVWLEEMKLPPLGESR